MAHFKFAVSGQVLDLLTSTKGIADDLYTNSFEFDFRSPEWATCDMKWAHFYNSDYNKIGPNGEAMPYDFNLVDDAITADRGVNLPYGIWEVFITGNVILNDNEVVQRFVTETQSIWIVQSGVINAEPLGSIEASEVERLSALAGGAYNARITAATATIEDPNGDVSASVAINGENGTKQLDFVFTGLNNSNKLFKCTYGETTANDIAEAVRKGLLPWVRVTSSQIRAAGYTVASGTEIAAEYHGHESRTSIIPSTGQMSFVDTDIFSTVVNSVYWAITLTCEVITGESGTVTETWGISRNGKLDSEVRYNSSTKTFYNYSSDGGSSIITMNDLKSGMDIKAGDIAYNPDIVYESGTVGSALNTYKSIFWCEYGVTTYQEIRDALDNNLLPVVVEHIGGSAVSIAPFVGMGGMALTCYFTNYYDNNDNQYTCLLNNEWKKESKYSAAQVSYSSITKKLTQVGIPGFNGAVDIVTVAQLKEDMGVQSYQDPNNDGHVVAG